MVRGPMRSRAGLLLLHPAATTSGTADHGASIALLLPEPLAEPGDAVGLLRGQVGLFEGVGGEVEELGGLALAARLDQLPVALAQGEVPGSLPVETRGALVGLARQQGPEVDAFPASLRLRRGAGQGRQGREPVEQR